MITKRATDLTPRLKRQTPSSPASQATIRDDATPRQPPLAHRGRTAPSTPLPQWPTKTLAAHPSHVSVTNPSGSDPLTFTFM